MRRTRYLVTLTLILTSLFVFAGAASADPPSPQDADPHTQNIHDMGHDRAPASLFYGPPDIHTDIAFWGQYAIQGNWTGFRILDISAPGNPKLISYTECNGNQGDVVVWQNIVVRSWNSPALGTTSCGGQTVPAGFEGLHVFDISNVNSPVLLAAVNLSNGAIPGRCGSHTATGVPDPANNRLLIYNSGSQCDGIDIVEVPLNNPAAAAFLRLEPAGRNCHDTSVILGDAMLAACAGGNGYTMWRLNSGALEDPELLYSRSIPGVTIGHSGSFSWDGRVFVFGHEPGGGVGASCEASDPITDRSFFFFEAANGNQLGMWTLPRPQTALENCTLHNFNVVPLRSGRYVIAHGSYQSGTSIVDFTDPANAFEVGYSDPPPIVPQDLGGAWSTYWYNNFLYETNITEGLNILLLSDSARAGAMRLPYLNPQTQDFTIAAPGKRK
ncbi:MAG: hypothetical protein H3C34_15040 [Caldilineaceae bacterium]|nr:hypothetical protein [Caldilineaceae bacterium]